MHCETVAYELWTSLQVLLGFTKSTQVNHKLASKCLVSWLVNRLVPGGRNKSTVQETKGLPV
jgi:hypothetical protein